MNTAVTQMDKVTLSNAANAEESAAASEELSAQAEQMRSVVAELMALVGSTTGDKSRGKAPRRGTRVTTSTGRKASADESAHANHQRWGEEGFTEFGRAARAQPGSETAGSRGMVTPAAARLV